MDRDVASSPLGPKSAPPTRQLKRKSLPDKKTRQSLKSVGLAFTLLWMALDNERDAPSPTPSKSTRTRSVAKVPEKSPAKARGKPSGESPVKMSLDQDDAVQEPAKQHVVDGPSASTEAPTDEPATNGDKVETQYIFDKFTDHRWAGNSIEIQVQWQDGDLTWEQEAVLHEDARDALLAYWASQGGRPTNPHDPDLFDIYAIRKHSSDRKKLLVEWVGYDPKEASWVPRAVVEETAPKVVAAYWQSVRGARPGRPRRRRGNP
ncbi:hypothetical protein E4U42_000853 [Claviceps africana]|uniref:Chromo domain-containing protein n=1 Tax=Claviceps africana TaxID=83212 RepID=A0A8K0JC78_9HYPO|nr:hypothetical protein E4U42_000853 [Claviceps africana]